MSSRESCTSSFFGHRVSIPLALLLLCSCEPTSTSRAPSSTPDNEAHGDRVGDGDGNGDGDSPSDPEDDRPTDDAGDPGDDRDVPDAGDTDDGERDAGAGNPAGDGDGDGLPEAEPTIVGKGGIVHSTIVVQAGEVFDGDNKRYTAGSELGDGSQSETQKPVFKLEDGARLQNVVLGSPAADGIHTHGDVTLKNIHWEDIGEDALTIKASGTVVLDGGSAQDGEDKVFQINAASTFHVMNFEAHNAGKFIRQNGGTKFKVDVIIDHCDISRMDEAIFRTDSDVSTVAMHDTRYSEIGKELFMGVEPGNVTQSGNTEY
ncbi:MAG: pectate lyase [Myxococcales bacterium]